MTDTVEPEGGPDSVVRLRDQSLAWRHIEGEVVILDLESSEYLAVNRSGAALWGLLADGATRGQLVGALVERYGLEPAQAAIDTDAFVGALADRDLLEI